MMLFMGDVAITANPSAWVHGGRTPEFAKRILGECTLALIYKRVLYVLCRKILMIRKTSRTFVANNNATAIRSPYMANGFAPAFA